MSDERPKPGEFYRVQKGDAMSDGRPERSKNRTLPPCVVHTPIAKREGYQINLYANVTSDGKTWLCPCAVCGMVFTMTVDEVRAAIETAVEGAKIAMGIL